MSRTNRAIRARTRTALALLGLAAPLLVGCAGRPTGTLVPVSAVVAGTSRVDMLVATTREPSAEPGVLFSGERGQKVLVENIVVSVPPGRTPGTLTYPGNPVDPQTQFTVRSIAPAAGRDADTWFRRVVGPEGDVLIFVHGFNTTYEESVFRFAQIVHDTGAKVAPILFTWPSQGSVFNYLYDRESANFSRSALETVIARAVDSPKVRSVTVMAHSMGSWLTMEALRQFAIRRGGLPAKVRNVVLASPDVDIDVFTRQLDDLGQESGVRSSAKPGTRFTVFAASDDRALMISRRLAGGVQRLGSANVVSEPYRSEFERRGVTIVDLSDVQTGDGLGHTKFAESPRIVQLIGHRLLSGQPITDSILSIGEAIGAAAVGTAQTVGSAAAAAVSVPGAIVNEQERRVLRRQIQNTGESLGGTVQTVVGR
jgi:esterase/lipase superfamily enzyme